MDWKNKVIFLTGASSGVGEALALATAKRGATFGLAAGREELLRELAEKCEQNDGKFAFALSKSAKSLPRFLGNQLLLSAPENFPRLGFTIK